MENKKETIHTAKKAGKTLTLYITTEGQLRANWNEQDKKIHHETEVQGRKAIYTENFEHPTEETRKIHFFTVPRKTHRRIARIREEKKKEKEKQKIKEFLNENEHAQDLKRAGFKIKNYEKETFTEYEAEAERNIQYTKKTLTIEKDGETHTWTSRPVFDAGVVTRKTKGRQLSEDVEKHAKLLVGATFIAGRHM